MNTVLQVQEEERAPRKPRRMQPAVKAVYEFIVVDTLTDREDCRIVAVFANKGQALEYMRAHYSPSLDLMGGNSANVDSCTWLEWNI